MNDDLAANPFRNFAAPAPERGELRRAITAAKAIPEPECVPGLIDAARVSSDDARAVHDRARKIVRQLRSRQPSQGMSSLLQEYSLSTREGIALMSLAEAMLRTPDAATRDALIRDKIGGRDWVSHIGTDRSLFVNASSWGLLLTGRLVKPADEKGLGHALTDLLARGGEPVIRQSVNMAMRLLGDQFVAGETMDAALRRARRSEEKGFSYSYDMLGEAAMTAEDAARYYREYETAIHAIGTTAAGRDVHQGPGISIKLSALHPRYERSHRGRVMTEMLPRVIALCSLARQYGIGLNIDAEEAGRLETSLDILEMLAFSEELAGWDGLGFVVQAYGKRAPQVIDHLVDLGRRSGRRIMVRLVKGAYWDSEIKLAQIEGLADYPVFTRKVHTDVSFQACVKKMLAAPDAIYPQFATHNAQTVAYCMQMAGPWEAGKYEFQCLYGMGEPLYHHIVADAEQPVPCRIYAPVGSHETLLAYLVRRLLENGANSSFVNQVADPDADDEALVADPVEEAASVRPLGSPHPRIPLPKDILGARVSPTMPDLTDEDALTRLAGEFAATAQTRWTAAPPEGLPTGDTVIMRNPADRDDIVGSATFAAPGAVPEALERARAAQRDWSGQGIEKRALCLEHAAEIMEERMVQLSGLIVREAGKTAANAIGDVREAIDFLRYYAAEMRRRPDAEPLGVITCISPWNFPSAIFLGQVSAALVAGNAVIAKPAEETPLIAAAVVRLLHEAGVPGDAVQLLPGAGEIGAALVENEKTDGVIFTGSTEVGHLINKTIARRTNEAGHPVPLIAETGGQNAMIVDSSALAEQVVADVMMSAFDSAGQRCSALRILCIQEDVADRLTGMVKSAMDEWLTGNPVNLSTDVGPVITAEARDTIEDYIQRRRNEGFAVKRPSQRAVQASGTFVTPAIIELNSVDDLAEEVFGPVLHVIRYARKDRDRLIERINALGYGLTFGFHSRLDEQADDVALKASAGNIYVNRNIVGAVVGVQPFGGHGLSGTGPKAGGPLYLNRMLRTGSVLPKGEAPADLRDDLADWAKDIDPALRESVMRDFAESPLGYFEELPGPAGEANTYRIESRGNVLVVPQTEAGLVRQLAAVLATGNRAVLEAGSPLEGKIPQKLAGSVELAERPLETAAFSAALVERGDAEVTDVLQALAARPGPLVVPQVLQSADMTGAAGYRLDLLVTERAVSVNTAAAGGNASLMTLEP